jgi:predicted PolB exonuclease-like 3'-5' exonuclease
MLARFFEDDDQYLCAHNGKEFDFPFLARRYLINELELPYCLDLAGKKPWEVQHLDTMNLWKFGDYKHYTSLDLLTHAFNIPSPKSTIDGSDVARLFYEEKNYEAIKNYCEDDVIAMSRLLMKWKGQPSVEDKKIIRIT